MGRKYKNPPIIEVVCEFQFSADSPWDLTMPGLIYERIKETFPKKIQESVLTVQVPTSVVAPSPFIPQLQSENRMRFVHPDEHAFLQLQPHLLAINYLQPYPSWERFLPLIRQSFTAYQDVVSPIAIHRIGLRYINRITIPTNGVELSEPTDGVEPSEYFTLYPQMSSELPSYGGFSVQVLFPYNQGRDLLKIDITSALDETGQTVVAFLDLDYFLAQPNIVTPNHALDWIAQAHDTIEHAFEACITEKLRRQFDQEA